MPEFGSKMNWQIQNKFVAKNVPTINSQLRDTDIFSDITNPVFDRSAMIKVHL